MFLEMLRKMSWPKLALIGVALVLAVILLTRHFTSGPRIGDEYCSINGSDRKISNDKYPVFLGTSYKVDDIANGIVKYSFTVVVSDQVAAVMQEGLGTLQSYESVEKFKITMSEQNLSKSNCSKLFAIKQNIDSKYDAKMRAAQATADEEKAKATQAHDKLMARLTPGAILCSFDSGPSEFGPYADHYVYRIYKYEGPDQDNGGLAFDLGEYDPGKNKIALVTDDDGSPRSVDIMESNLDADFPTSTTFFGREACIAEANKKFKPLTTKITDAGLKIGDIVCPNPPTGLIYKITYIGEDINSGYGTNNGYGDIAQAPQQYASTDSVTFNKQTRQIASDDDGTNLYIYPAMINKYHFGKDNCLKDLAKFNAQKQNQAKF